MAHSLFSKVNFLNILIATCNSHLNLIYLFSNVYLVDVITTTDVIQACKGVDIAIMLGGFPRMKGMSNKDLIKKNIGIYKAQASALEQHADPNCKVGFTLVI